MGSAVAVSPELTSPGWLSHTRAASASHTRAASAFPHTCIICFPTHVQHLLTAALKNKSSNIYNVPGTVLSKNKSILYVLALFSYALPVPICLGEEPTRRHRGHLFPFKNYFTTLWMWMFCQHVCLCNTCVGALGGQKKVPDPLELEL